MSEGGGGFWEVEKQIVSLRTQFFVFSFKKAKLKMGKKKKREQKTSAKIYCTPCLFSRFVKMSK